MMVLMDHMTAYTCY